MEQKLFTLRYRTGSLGVQTAFLMASNQARAEQVGQTWCNLEPFRKYIAVVPSIIADEGILGLPPEEEVPVRQPVAPPKQKAS